MPSAAASPDATTGQRGWNRQPAGMRVGSGGSPFDAKPGVQTLSATDRYYAWVTVSVHASGKTILEAWGFDDHFGPLRKLRTLRLDKPG